uniref:Uncharacterized protein n=1 Tax=Arundo donax TaxID=35708 RepID=A0A0A8Y8X5_ARUDO
MDGWKIVATCSVGNRSHFSVIHAVETCESQNHSWYVELEKVPTRCM